jgi:hypothetical protein
MQPFSNLVCAVAHVALALCRGSNNYSVCQLLAFAVAALVRCYTALYVGPGCAASLHAPSAYVLCAGCCERRCQLLALAKALAEVHDV